MFKAIYFSRSYNPLADSITETIFKAYIIVFSDPKDQDFYQTFNYFWNTSFITDVIVISKEGPCIDVYSYQPFTSTSCNVVSVQKIHKLCEKSSNLKTFPRIIKDLHKCVIRGSASTGLIHKTLKSPFYEETTLNLLSTVMNFTFEISRKDIRTDVETFDVTKFDVAYGANILTEKRVKIMSPSYPHSSKSLYMFLKYEKNCKTSLEILLEPFHWTVWLALIASSALGTIVLAISNKSSFMKESSAMLRILLGIPIQISSSCNFSIRIQYFNWMCLGLVISACHHAIFFDILKFNLLKPLPRTLQEVVRTNFVHAIMVPEPISVEISEYLRRFTDIEIVVERVNGIIPAVLHGKERILGIATMTMVAFSGEDIDSFSILEDKLTTIFSAVYFRKNSFLLNTFNKLVLDLYSGGFLQKWRDDFFGQMFGKSIDVSQVKALSMGELYGIFNIGMVLLLVSAGCFVAEIISFKFKDSFLNA